MNDKAMVAKKDTGQEAVTHRTLVAGLGAAEKAALLARSDGAGLRQLALHWGAIVVLGTMIWARVPFWPLLILPQGILLAFLFTAEHEAIHDSAFASPWLNRLVANVCGFLVLVPPDWFRFFHFAHHRHTHDPARDPELGAAKPKTRRAYLIYLTGLPVWRDLAKALWANAAGQDPGAFVPRNKLTLVRGEARLFLTLYAVLALTALADLILGEGAFARLLFFTWLLPIVLGAPFLRAYLMAEHTLCPHEANMLVNTRTTYTNPLVRRLAWNMPYHVEHHVFPAVPFHQLPRLHALIKPHLRETAPGYLAFHRRIWREYGRPADADPSG